MDLIFDYWYVIAFVFVAIAMKGDNQSKDIEFEVQENEPPPIKTKQDYKYELLTQYASKGYVPKDPYADALIQATRKKAIGQIDERDANSLMKTRFCFDDDAQRAQRIAKIEAYKETQDFLDNNPMEAYLLKKKNEVQYEYVPQKGLFATIIDAIFVEKAIEKQKVNWQGGEVVETYTQERDYKNKGGHLNRWSNDYDTGYKRPDTAKDKISKFLKAE